MRNWYTTKGLSRKAMALLAVCSLGAASQAFAAPFSYSNTVAGGTVPNAWVTDGFGHAINGVPSPTPYLLVDFAVEAVPSALSAARITLTGVNFDRMQDTKLELIAPDLTTFVVFDGAGPVGIASGTYVFSDNAVTQFSSSSSLAGGSYLSSSPSFTTAFTSPSYAAGTWQVAIQHWNDDANFTVGSVTLDLGAAAVPEPTALAAMALGSGGLLIRRRQKKQA